MFGVYLIVIAYVSLRIYHLSFFLYFYRLYLVIALSSTAILFFFFNDTATTEIYTLSLHDALPIFVVAVVAVVRYGHSVLGHVGQSSRRVVDVDPIVRRAAESVRLFVNTAVGIARDDGLGVDGWTIVLCGVACKKTVGLVAIAVGDVAERRRCQAAIVKIKRNRQRAARWAAACASANEEPVGVIAEGKRGTAADGLRAHTEVGIVREADRAGDRPAPGDALGQEAVVRDGGYFTAGCARRGELTGVWRITIH